MAETDTNLKFAKEFVDLANATLDASVKFKNSKNQAAFRNFAVYLMERAQDQTEYEPSGS